ncbi:MAG: rhamnogalacturonan acetylesterase [Acholeplasmatales bacterium]|nr:rhamnogalacturonan acetylesterase [Acholeplasmatales bacterium]
MKIRKAMGILGLGIFALTACQAENNSGDSTESTGSAESTTFVNNDREATIFLAGDSTVKTYSNDQYIGGWGQYLDLFLDNNITVKNCAQGGRSSRSFINEGRLYDIDGSSYTFSENGGNSIEDDIKAGDYLFIQFGHNDDDTKAANSLAERMVPLGEPVNRIYPVTAGTKTQIVKSDGVATLASVSSQVSQKMSSYTDVLNNYLKNSVSKYGPDYYEYSSGGTYKWFLKQYIDFARGKGAVPVLVTPVARVSFNSDGTLKSGAGLHGDDFAYVKAVRQLAEEENCFLIDLFNDTKEMLETLKQQEANYIMALKDSSGSNGNTGLWPSGFDTEYQKATKESTHYNKFGAYLSAGKVAEHLKEFISSNKKCKNNEEIGFKNSVLSTPESYIAPSNLMHKETATKLYNLFSTVRVNDPNFTYPDPSIVSNLIAKMVTDYPSVTQENYLAVKDVCIDIRSKFVLINVDDVNQVTNIAKLDEYEEAYLNLEKANRPVATETIVFDPSDLTNASGSYITSETSLDGFKIYATTDKNVTVTSGATFSYNDNEYTTTKSLSMGGAATFGSFRYIEFTTTKKASITVVAKSSGTDDRIVRMITKSDKADAGTFDAKTAVSVTTINDLEAGTYQLGSANKGLYIYAIIIEYFD